VSPHQFRLYRHFDADGNLLYIGVSLNAFARLAQHRDSSSWFSEIANVTFQAFETREAVLEAEASAIQAENPKYNVHHKGKKPVAPLQPVSESEPSKVVCLQLSSKVRRWCVEIYGKRTLPLYRTAEDAYRALREGRVAA
jgi:excinuclease UvrABC nuclease subunit